MIAPRSPIHLSHTTLPRVQDFARLAALEAGFRGTLMSVMPLLMYRTLGDAALVSALYLGVGVCSLGWNMLVPGLSRIVPRRWMFTAACALYLSGVTLLLIGTPVTMGLALLVNALGTVTFSVCLSAYVLDYIARGQLGRNESIRMVYSALPWSAGPILGVTLLDIWRPAPFLIAGACALALAVEFWRLRLGNGKQIARARGPAPNPVAFLGRFARQPRLIAGWLFAVIRSCGWWVYVVYLPIFAIEAGLGEWVGGATTSLGNLFLLTTPAMLTLVNRHGVRASVRFGFLGAALLFGAAAVLAPLPWLAVGALACGAVMLVLLDVVAGLPFLMAVKPSERTEMAAVYSSFRDVSGILTPGIAWLVLLAFPVPAVSAAAGLGLATAWAVAGRLHPRLGLPRLPAVSPPVGVSGA